MNKKEGEGGEAAGRVPNAAKEEEMAAMLV
jgi:hypothetical protein